MAESYPGDGAAANGFGRRHLHESEARLLYEGDYRAPPEIAARRRDRKEGDVVLLDDSDEEAPGPSNPFLHGGRG
ncbi:hypothetical protein D1007_03524 [Hordeum vulgare]|nr:hypothetical protein D1007_03524 [Hordeum vulgare]